MDEVVRRIPLYDEEDHSALEADEISEAWDDYAERDLASELPEDVRDAMLELEQSDPTLAVIVRPDETQDSHKVTGTKLKSAK